jgi:serine/threonine protein kinase
MSKLLPSCRELQTCHLVKCRRTGNAWPTLNVAIKLLPSEFALDTDRLRRFEQEARATSALNHPNILTIYDIGTHGGTPFIVAELLEGEELRELLNDGPLPARKALDYAQQTAMGLAAAHEKAIVHRDLKPENLSLTMAASRYSTSD